MPAAARKTVTALFADLGGSTGFGERVDAETARAVIGRYHALLQEVVDAHAGTVAKFIGDGMLAFFGIPEVAEDDAVRAVAAAADMQRRFSAFADEVADAHGERLTFRVGVNSGEVVIGDGDADVVGDALNVAARLEKACHPGRVLVGEATWRLTRSSFGFEPVGEVEVTGRAVPVAAYVLADDERPTHEATPFVGRDGELTRLRAALDDAVAARAARFVTVIGPPGVGKTRLSRELEQSLEDRTRVLHTACERAGGSTFGPLVDLIRPAMGGEATRESLAAIVPATEAERDRVIDGLAGVVGLGEARSTEETFWALRRLVESLAADQPLVLVIDDIQWAEARLLDLLEHLAEWVADAPVLLVGLARPELREVRPALAEPGRRVADVLVLDGLDPAATARLASEMLGGHGLPAELVARLPESTDGNPLFVRELVRMLVDEGTIRRDGEDWRLTVDADAVEVPPTIRSLLATRIERLPVAERTVLERASVVGPDFALGAVRALMEEDGTLDDRLEALRRRDLVEPTGSYWGEEPVWRFHHVLIRDAVYGRLLKGDRAELHERVGDWTAGAAPHVVGEHETAIAHHYEQAHGYRSQLGVLDEHGRELGQRTAGLLAVAARRSLVQDDLVAAASLATRALACVDDGAVERAELLLLAAEAILASGDLAQAPTVLEDLADLGATDTGLAAWADVYRAQWLDLTDPTRLDEVERLADHATERFAEAGDGSGQAKAHLVRASVLARRGRLADSEVELDRAMGAAREAKDRRRLVAALGAAPAVALWGPSPVARAGGRCLDVIRLLRITTQSPVVEATSLRHQAVLEALRGRFEPARQLLTDVRSTVEDLGLRRDLMEVELFEGIVDLLDGEPVAAEGRLRAAHEGLAALGAAAASGAAALLARALLAQGRVDDAAQLAGFAASTSGQDLKAAIAWGSVTAEIRASRGDAAEAVAAAQEAAALAEGTDLVLDHADALAALARVRRITGDLAGAESAAVEARRRYEAKGSTVHGGKAAAPQAAPSVSETETRHQALNPENLAARVTRELTARWLAEGPDAVLDRYVPDCRLVDRRRGLGSELVGREGLRAQLQAILDLIGADGRLVLREVVAQRGEHLALLRQGVEADGYEVEMLSLVEVDADGRQVASTLFDLDQLPDAMGDLEAWHQALTPENRAARLYRERVDRWMAEGADAVAETISPAYRSVDRRLGAGSEIVGRDGIRTQLQTITDLIGDGRIELGDVIAQRGERLVLLPQTAAVEGFGIEMLALIEVAADGRQVATTLFDLDDLAVALAELDRRHAELSAVGTAPLANRAARLNVVLIERFVEDGADAVVDLIAEDIHFEDRRIGLQTVTDGREAHLANLGGTDDLWGESRFATPELIASRGEHLVLSRQFIVGDAEVEMLTVTEFDAVDRICLLFIFDPDDLGAALAEMDRRYAELSNVAPAPVDNRASRLNLVLIDRWMSEGADAVADLIADGIHFEDRRPGLGTVIDGRAAHLANMRAVDELRGESRFQHREVVATRGERLVLARQEIVGEAEIELLALAEFDADDRMRLAIMFDPDDLEGALTELYERFLEGEGAAHAAEIRASTACARAIATADDVALASLLTVDFVCADHRLIGFGELDREGFRAAIAARPETVGVGVAVASEIFLRPGLVLTPFELRARSTVGSEQHHVGWSLVQVRDGRVDRLELFGPDDRAAAMARFDDLSMEESSEPLVVRRFRQQFELLTSGDIEAAVDLVAGHCVTEDRRQGMREVTIGRDDHLAAGHALHETLRGATFGIGEVLAHRGAHLAAVRLDTVGRLGPTVQSHAVIECDAAGLLAGLVVFDLDAVGDALRELDRRYAAGAGRAFAAEVTTSAVGGQAVATGDADAFAALATDDFVCVDHRLIGWGERDRETFLAAVAARPDTLGRGLWIGQEMRPRPGVVLTVYEIRTDADVVEVGVSVATMRGDRCDRLEVFAEDDRAAAEARFDQLAAAMPAAGNLAVRQAFEFRRRWIAEGVAATRTFFAEDYHLVDRRTGLGNVDEGFDALAANLQVAGEVLGHEEFQIFAVVAERGDRLALLDQGVDGDVVIRELALSEVDLEGRSIRTDIFDREDLEAAVDELDRRFADGEGAPFADEVAVCAAAWKAIAAGDAEALDPLLSEDFVLVDHLPLRGWLGEIDRTGYLRSIAARAADLGVGIGFPRSYLSLTPGVVLVDYELSLRRSADGFETTESGLVVAAIRGGQLTRVEVFAEEDRQQAEARFEELPGSNPGPGIANAATRRLAPYADRFARRDWAWLRELCDEHIRNDDRRSGVNSGVSVGRARLLELTEALADSGFTAMRQVPVAVRGEELVLFLRTWGHEDGFELALLALMEVDATGHLVANTMWEADDWALALDELDRRFAEGEGAANAEVLALCLAFVRSLGTGDAEALETLLTEDFVLVDHLPLRDGFGEISRAQWLFVMADRPAVLGQGFGFIPSYLRFEPGLILSSYELRSRTSAGFESTESGLAVSVIRDGRIARTESFAVEDRDAAEACFEALRRPS